MSNKNVRYTFFTDWNKVEREVERIAAEVSPDTYHAYNQQPFYIDLYFARELTEEEEAELKAKISEIHGLTHFEKRIRKKP